MGRLVKVTNMVRYECELTIITVILKGEIRAKTQPPSKSDLYHTPSNLPQLIFIIGAPGLRSHHLCTPEIQLIISGGGFEMIHEKIDRFGNGEIGALANCPILEVQRW